VQTKGVVGGTWSYLLGMHMTGGGSLGGVSQKSSLREVLSGGLSPNTDFIDKSDHTK